MSEELEAAMVRLVQTGCFDWAGHHLDEPSTWQHPTPRNLAVHWVRSEGPDNVLWRTCRTVARYLIGEMGDEIDGNAPFLHAAFEEEEEQ